MRFRVDIAAAYQLRCNAMQVVWTIPGEDTLRAYLCGELFSQMAFAAHALSCKVCVLLQPLCTSHYMLVVFCPVLLAHAMRDCMVGVVQSVMPG